MADFREEAYILEKVEISEDEDDGEFQYEEIKDTTDLDGSLKADDFLDAPEDDDDDDDLDNFEALKARTTMKMLQQ